MANFAYGVTGDLTVGPFAFYDVGDGTVTTPFEGTASVLYDGAQTMQTFMLPIGTDGAIPCEMSLNQFNSIQASQSLSPLSFNLNIADQNFTYV